jgi:hypothetical protein
MELHLAFALQAEELWHLWASEEGLLLQVEGFDPSESKFSQDLFISIL